MIPSIAYAQAGGGTGGGGIMEMVLMMGGIFAVFYFFMIRPQQKRVREHQRLVESLRRGDRVVTSGGLAGTVTRVLEPPFIQLEVAEGVRVRVTREHVQQVLNRSMGGAPEKEKTVSIEKKEKPESKDKT